MYTTNDQESQVKIVFLHREKIAIRRVMKLLTTYIQIVLSCCCLFTSVSGQEKILFSVEDESVALNEFLYIYEKTNRDKADFSNASVQEYLDLYQKFKLKVYKAREMRLDTIKALQVELAGYRKQLAASYLSDREVLETLAKEAFDRMQEDVSFSHILFRLPPNASSKDSTGVYEKAMAALDRLRDGEDFSALALELSDDETVKENQGKVGHVTAMLPDGFYELETTLYTLPLKRYSRPVLSRLGYHVVTRHNKRPARGEIEVAHILIRNERGRNGKPLIDSIQGLLLKGADFAELAMLHSEDKLTASKGGYLGFFGINKYESIFENTAFRLKNDGAVSVPIKTSIGWHIVKRLSVKPTQTYDQIKRSLETKIKNDGRFAIAEDAMLDNIKEENNFELKAWDQDLFLSQIGEQFLTYQWKSPAELTQETIFTLGGRDTDTRDFSNFLVKNTASRLRVNRMLDKKKALQVLLSEFINQKLLEFEESQLESKYPEFKALMREYSEGILLFEATKMKVWDKASQDTIGLRNFYQRNKQRYKWPERAAVETITIHTTDRKVLEKVQKQMLKKSGDRLLKKFNRKSELITIESESLEREELSGDLSWKKNDSATAIFDEAMGAYTIQRVAKLVQPQIKSLDEARGYVIADYQDFLEKEWVDGLRSEYRITLHQDVLDSIIQN